MGRNFFRVLIWGCEQSSATDANIIKKTGLIENQIKLNRVLIDIPGSENHGSIVQIKNIMIGIE